MLGLNVLSQNPLVTMVYVQERSPEGLKFAISSQIATKRVDKKQSL